MEATWSAKWKYSRENTAILSEYAICPEFFCDWLTARWLPDIRSVLAANAKSKPPALVICKDVTLSGFFGVPFFFKLKYCHPFGIIIKINFKDGLND